MQRNLYRAITISAALLLALVIVGHLDLGTAPQAQAGNARNGLSGDLFYNYYVPPGIGGVGAQLYVSPLPTPPLVGHTFVTYQPLLPQEFLYQHHRTYFRHNPGAGWTKATVTWH